MKVLPNPRTKIAENPVVNAVILDFAVIIQMLTPKQGTFDEYFSDTFAHYIKKQLESVSTVHSLSRLYPQKTYD